MSANRADLRTQENTKCLCLHYIVAPVDEGR